MCSTRQGTIECSACACILSGFFSLAGKMLKGIERVAVEREVKLVFSFIENVLCAVTIVKINVENSDTLNPVVSEPLCRNCGIVQKQ